MGVKLNGKKCPREGELPPGFKKPEVVPEAPKPKRHPGGLELPSHMR